MNNEPQTWNYIRKAADWQRVKEYQDITYYKAQGVARIAFNRPEVRNAFRPETVDELIEAFTDAWHDTSIGTVIFTGEGAFAEGWRLGVLCGRRSARARLGRLRGGYVLPRLHVLELQRIIRFMPKVVICAVPGWAVGGGHSLHVVCDLTIASKEHARFHQADASVASFDGGYGSAYLAKHVGQKRAREIFFLEQVYR